MSDFLLSNIPVVTKTVPWTELHESLKEGEVTIWLNPSQDCYDLFNRYFAASKRVLDAIKAFSKTTENSEEGTAATEALMAQIEEKNQLRNAAYAEVWFKTPEEVESFAEIRKLRPIYNWCVERTWKEINAFGAPQKKG